MAATSGPAAELMTTGSFNPNAPQYRTACCHARSAAFCWTIFQLVLGCISLSVCIIALASIFPLGNDNDSNSQVHTTTMNSYFPKSQLPDLDSNNENKNNSAKDNEDIKHLYQASRRGLLITIIVCLCFTLISASLALHGIRFGKWKLVVPYFCIVVLSAAIYIIVLFLKVAAGGSFFGEAFSALFNIALGIFVVLVFYRCIQYLKDRKAAIKRGDLLANCSVNPSLLQPPVAIVYTTTSYPAGPQAGSIQPGQQGTYPQGNFHPSPHPPGQQGKYPTAPQASYPPYEQPPPAYSSVVVNEKKSYGVV